MSETAIPPAPCSRFTTALAVRPDDIDMNRHVHNSRYFDYVLAARFDQMARCYGMPMEAFGERGFGWVVRTAHIDYKRPLVMGDRVDVTTWVESFHGESLRVRFEIHRLPREGRPAQKLACDGWFDYTLVALATGRATPIPADIVAVYSI